MENLQNNFYFTYNLIHFLFNNDKYSNKHNLQFIIHNVQKIGLLVTQD